MGEKMLFSGSSLQQAVLAAARHFRLDADDVAYRARESRQGLVRGRQRIVIEVDPESPGRPAPQPVAPAVPQPAAPTAVGFRPARAIEPERPRRSSSPPAEVREPQRRPPTAPSTPRSAAEGPAAEAAQTALEHLARLAGLGLEAQILQEPTGLLVDIGGQNQPALIADDARLLEAVEHLLPRVARGLLGEAVAVRVDSDGLHERLHEELRGVAREAASRVKRSGQPELLPEMSPADRRIVHLTLADDPDLTTESLGSGVFKRVQVRLA